MIIVNRKFILNSNCFILGVLGSGKSFAAKEEMVNLLPSVKADVMITDPEREYSALVEAMGGKGAELSAKSKSISTVLILTRSMQTVQVVLHL